MIRLIYGDNDFALSEERRKVVSVFLEKHDRFGYELIDTAESDAAQLVDALLQLPFLAEKKLVVLLNVFSAKKALEFVTENIENIADGVEVLIVEPRPDKRTKLFKLLQSQQAVTEFSTVSPVALARWVLEYAAKLGAQIQNGVAEELIQRVGPSQMMLAREIEKLAVHGMISADMIQEQTQKHLSGSVFDLLSALFARRADVALDQYETLLKMKTDPNEILSLISWQLHVFAVVLYATEKTTDHIAKEAKLHPFVVSKAVSVARSLGRDRLQKALNLSVAAELNIKTRGASSEDTVRVLLLEISHI